MVALALPVRRAPAPVLVVHTTRWMIWYASVIHSVWAALLLMRVQASMATPVKALNDVIPGDGRVLALVLLAAVGLAVAASKYATRGSPWAVALLAPQQVLLLISALGGLDAVLQSHYGDGVQRPWGFILADQFPSLAAATLHTFAMLERPVKRLWPTRSHSR